MHVAAKQMAKRQMKKQVKKQIQKKIQQKIKQKIKEKIQEKIQEKIMEKVMDTVQRIKLEAEAADEELYLMQSMKKDGEQKVDERKKYLKHILGFTCGCLLMYVLYLLLVSIMAFQSSTGIIVCGVLGAFASFGLAFSRDMRCIALLILPSFFAGKGRTMLMMYGFILVLSGPMMNLSHNMDVAGNSIACGSALALNQSHTIFELMTAPLTSIANDLREMTSEIRGHLNVLLEAIREFGRSINNLVEEISKFFDWLEDALNACQETLGQPELLCRNKFTELSATCMTNHGRPRLCGILDTVGGVCVVLGSIKIGCAFHAAVNFIANGVANSFAIAVDNIEDELSVDIAFEHRFNLDVDFSKTLSNITTAIVKEVHQRTQIFRDVLGCMGFIMSFSAILIFVKALKYRNSYLVKDSFDNWCITQEIEDLDDRRKKMDKPTILPLKGKELQKYKTPNSIFLAPKEKRKLTLGLTSWGTNTGYAALVILADYCAFSFLSLVNKHAELRVLESATGTIHLLVDGEGFLANVYRVLVHTMDPSERYKLTIDTTTCLPQPAAPDYFTIRRIVIIFCLCLLFIVTEAYGLRIRRIVAAYYYPHREQERAVWLYNNILRKRGTFTEFLWKRLKQIPSNDNAEVVSFKSRLAAKSKICRTILKQFGYKMSFCVSCGQPGQPDDRENFRYCDNRGCKGIFCLQCVMDINGICSFCMNPVEYELSDLGIEFERDSSEDELDAIEDQKSQSRKIPEETEGAKTDSKYIIDEVEDT
ncbi:DC-STAMP domain-containing protein 2-like isoform X2 [Apostichopus japonicus]|uniref:DC-STAMP domain-containing protein 2-like isoform X2 n=1 Tax=Stichopus japonicus TaxID=307972 RepID=UPI003AB4A6AF